MLIRLVCASLIIGLISPVFTNQLWAGDANTTVIESDCIEINLSSPDKTQPVNIHIDGNISRKFRFSPGEKLTIQVYVQSSDGKRHFIRDVQGQRRWELILDNQGRGRVTFLPDKINFTGRLAVLANQKVIHSPGRLDSGCPAVLEYVRESRFKDGAGIKVHFTSQILQEGNADEQFPQQVLDSARQAYERIVNEFGFNRKGYSFASADKNYAYDGDKTIDIYIGSLGPSDNFYFHSLNWQDFAKAPFYQVRYEGRYRYSAMIAVPADYKAYLKKASEQFAYSEAVDIFSHLKAAMMHEMLHIITFYYNKNLLSWYKFNPLDNRYQGGDWYVEGLARYFETFSGFNGNFYSASADFYQRPGAFRSGQNLSESGYDFAVFWKYFHSRFGMETIEKLSYRLRSVQTKGSSNEKAAGIINQVTGISFSEISGDFAEFVREPNI
jgi:hypothetical protein